MAQLKLHPFKNGARQSFSAACKAVPLQSYPGTISVAFPLSKVTRNGWPSFW
jgi:hypothetical protein